MGISRRFRENGEDHGDLQKFATCWGYFLKFPKHNDFIEVCIIKFIYSFASLMFRRTVRVQHHEEGREAAPRPNHVPRQVRASPVQKKLTLGARGFRTFAASLVRNGLTASQLQSRSSLWMTLKVFVGSAENRSPYEIQPPSCKNSGILEDVSVSLGKIRGSEN